MSGGTTVVESYSSISSGPCAPAGLVGARDHRRLDYAPARAEVGLARAPTGA